MTVGDTHVFPGFLTPVLTQLFFPKPPATFLTCYYRGESTRQNSADSVTTSNLVCIKEVAIRTTLCIAGIIY